MTAPVSPSTAPDSPLEQVIVVLQTYRDALGARAIDAAIAALRQHSESPLLPQAQRLRQVSVLFADVADSTAMLGRIATDEAAMLIGDAVQAFAEAVQQAGGEVLRYTGDGIKAAFGLQGLREDEAERAVRAGLRILHDAAQHAARVQAELGVTGFGVRVGIHSGPVLLGGGPDAERGAMGQAVHVAARMEQSAPAGRLRVSHATWSLLKGQFIGEAQDPLQVKGVDEPLRTWLIEREAPTGEAPVSDGPGGVHVPIVGRDHEIERLLGLHDRVLAECRSGALLVLAEAGLGKTRLRQEALQRLAERAPATRTLVVRAPPSLAQQPYGLLQRMLSKWLGIQDDAAAGQARQQLLDGLAPWLGGARSQEPQGQAAGGGDAACIGQLVGMDFAAHPVVQSLGGSALRERAFDALRRALQARAQSEPLLLVLDDLHWADTASLEFVATLLEPAPVPLLLWLFGRPTLAERGLTLGVEASATLRLEPLPEVAQQELLAALLAPLPDPPAALRSLLLERSAGNPFYLDALVRVLLDSGVIDASRRPWTVHAERLRSLQLPPTLVGVLQARLDALPASELQALQQASIIGPVFWDQALLAVAAAAPGQLPSLVDRRLVSARSGSAFADAAELQFSHALLHEVTYGTVLRAERRQGHAAVARWLADRVGDRAGEFLAVTAEHFERAGDSERALEYWDLAQVQAFRSFANDAALHAVERALAQPALTAARWRYSLMANRHEIFERLGRPADAALVSDEMAALGERHDDDAIRADQLAIRMLVVDQAGRSDEAEALARQVVEVGSRADESGAAALALGHAELAWLAIRRRDWAFVDAEIRAGLAAAHVSARVPRRQMGYDGYQHQVRVIGMQALALQDRHVEVLQMVAQAQAEPGLLLRDRFNLLSRKVASERLLGLVEQAAETTRELQVLVDSSGMPRLQVFALTQQADSALHERRSADAVAALLKAQELSVSVNAQVYLPGLLKRRAEAALQMNDSAAARQHWQAAVEGHVAQGEEGPAHELRCELARLDLAEGRTAEALQAADAALQYAGRVEPFQLRALPPQALVACHAVLQACADPRAGEVRQALLDRLDGQLAALPDDAARHALCTQVPHWLAAQALRDPGSVPQRDTAGTAPG